MKGVIPSLKDAGKKCFGIRNMVRDLAAALRSSDEEKVDEILGDAREEIDSFPDHSVGMAELKGYGYTADDMFPLRQEMALELHRVGEKVYCLQSDGSHGDYVSREMILEHEGLYGIEKEVLQRMQEQEDEIDFEEAGLYQSPIWNTMPQNVMNTIALAKYIRVLIWMRYLQNTGKSLMTQR